MITGIAKQDLTELEDGTFFNTSLFNATGRRRVYNTESEYEAEYRLKKEAFEKKLVERSRRGLR